MSPEILIVDEVLAVGDYEFQRRCLGKMNEVAHSGRTVLFVSHNMAAIEELCSQSILMRGGRIVSAGATQQVVADYMSTPDGQSSWTIGPQTEREGTASALITRIELLDAGTDAAIDQLNFRQSFKVRIHCNATKSFPDPRVGFAFLSDRGERVFQTETTEVRYVIPNIEIGASWFDCLVAAPNLLPGLYFLEVWIIERANVAFADHIHRIGRVEIGVDPEQQERMTYLTYPGRGRVLMDCRWSHPERIEGASLVR